MRSPAATTNKSNCTLQCQKLQMMMMMMMMMMMCYGLTQGVNLTPPPQNIEIQRMWNTKRFVILLITGAIGMVTEELKQYQETIQWILYKKKNCARETAHNKGRVTT
jgi:hypothetical protein